VSEEIPLKHFTISLSYILSKFNNSAGSDVAVEAAISFSRFKRRMNLKYKLPNNWIKDKAGRSLTFRVEECENYTEET
jgi:hypothetical protein